MTGRLGPDLTLPDDTSFWAVAVIAFLAFAANTAVSPLYRLYQVQFSFSATTLTSLFTVYVVVLLATLLFFGSLSDHVGRRPVMVAGLATGVAACTVFLIAHGVGLLFVARALQGVGAGLTTGAASAALLELRPGSATASLVSSAAPTGGQAVGAIGASALAQYAPAPTRLVWWLLLGAFVVAIVAVQLMPEPGARRPGALASLRPQVVVPRATRAAFVVAAPCLAGLWALAGFYLSLGPSLAARLLHSRNLVWGGILILTLTGLAAAASTALVQSEPSDLMLGGCVALVAGALATFTAIDTGTPIILFIGSAVAGLGFGPAFMGAFRAIVAAARTDERAGLVTAIYIVSYLATGIPAVIGGVATSHYGVINTSRGYTLAVAAITAIAAILVANRRHAAAGAFVRSRDPSPPPGPGTVPPCIRR